jgi:hypothetical protein
VGAGGEVPAAYHIKVAVADNKRMWLSSGNWQSSNLAPFDYRVPGSSPPLPIGRYNRDYHVVTNSPTLAKCYAAYIDYDAHYGESFAAPLREAEPYLLVPEECDFSKKRFTPLTVEGQIKVTPLLTPDNFPTFVNSLLKKAKQRIWIQNQYIEPAAEGSNFPEFDELMELLGEAAGKLDMRLCLRSLKDEHRDRILASGVKPAQLRLQQNCHAKLIVVDDQVVVGSQNLSNLGFVANRDASLAFEDPRIVNYFAGIFAEDWEHAPAFADGNSAGYRIARSEETPPGFARVPWSEVFDSPPPVTPARNALQPAKKPQAATRAAAFATVAPAVIPLFGVDRSGSRKSESVAAIAAALRSGVGVTAPESQGLKALAKARSFGLPFGPNTENLSETGWGVVWAPNTSPKIKEALRPLLEHRRNEVGDPALFHEFDYEPGEIPDQFLERNGAYFGGVKPKAVPLYLLLVGSPAEIPFAFQSVLDVEYRVGRLDLSDPAAYEQYARSVVAVEKGTTRPRDRVLHGFGPAHPGDSATAISAEVLVRAAPHWIDEYPALKSKYALTSEVDFAASATKARLEEILHGKPNRPEFLFTAGHGLLLACGAPQQTLEQGALVTADWDGIGGVDESCLFAAADVPKDADVNGMVVFLFACFGAGTPATDSFPTHAGNPLAPKPFVAALPRTLLSHSRGAALGVFGHVDRTLTWSLQPPEGPVATEPFSRATLNVLVGNRLGAALDDLNQRGASLASVVSNELLPGAAPIEDAKLVTDWTEQRDAAAFVLLGDPAARLRR